MKKERKTRKTSADWLVVGLGNPGVQYAATRHNIGWMVCEALCSRYKVQLQQGAGQWLEALVSLGPATALVVLPTTYMNRSGKAVAEAQRLFRIPTERVVVVVDEYNFPVGKVHLKSQGSDGGHNGVASVIAETGTPAFWRLRCGIDRNFGPGGLVDYVLAPFAPAEEQLRDAMIEAAVEAIKDIALMGPQRAMTAVNSRPLPADAAAGSEKKIP